MKKILVVVPYNNGTIGSCSLNIFKSLCKIKDLEVKCVLIHKFKDGYKEFDDCDYCVNGSFIGVKRYTAFLKECLWLKNIKQSFNPDITISTLFSCSTLSILTGGKDKKIGVFHSPHTQVKCRGKVEYERTLWTYRYLYSRLDHLYCVSEEVKNSIVSTFPSINKNKVEVVYNIHNIERIKQLSKENLTADDNKIFNNPVILYCGRLDKNKAPERLLKAFIAAKEISQSTQLVYIGQDVSDLWESLQTIAKDAGIEERVHYLGMQSNPYKYMKRSAALVSCSYSEGLPGVLIESLLLGIPVVSTNSSVGVWEILNAYNDYNLNLDRCYKAKKGIITPNLGISSLSSDNEKDIENLAYALDDIFSENYRNAPFEFEKNVKAENVIDKFILN